VVKARYVVLLISMLTFFGGYSQQVKVYQSFDDFQPLLQHRNDTTYVINFWATWCKPCVEEMPGFLALDEKYRNEKFKLILASLDFENKIESKVIPYMKKNNIEAEVVLLADPKVNVWIDKVNNDWVGSIPATVIYNKDFYFFREGMLSFEELDEIITNNIKP
jgi:thiol-disulfide isomerase/thioredoxin